MCYVHNQCMTFLAPHFIYIECVYMFDLMLTMKEKNCVLYMVPSNDSDYLRKQHLTSFLHSRVVVCSF